MGAALVSSRVGFGAVSVGVVALAAGAAGPPGDDPSSCLPLVIGTQTGSTAGLTDDSNETCPYSGSTSPDVYYCFTPTTTMELSFDLCESGYDTQVYVYDSNLEIVEVIEKLFGACNDDACSSSGGGSFRSRLECVPFVAGASYFVVVDGWQGDAGPYTLVVGRPNCAPVDPCVIKCPNGATPEGESCDFGDTAPNDLYNGGCNCTDPAGCFQDVVCGETICGQGYYDGTFRDTDWFAVDIDGLGPVSLELTSVAEFRAVLGRRENIDCALAIGFAEVIIFEPCTLATLTTAPDEDTRLQLFFAADFAEIVDCNVGEFTPGPNYVLTIECVLECPLDLDESGDVGMGDLMLILSDWGPCDAVCPSDLDDSDEVGFSDLMLILSNWGPCP